MNTSILKAGALIIFLAGIIAFVAFRAGLFDADKETKTGNPQVDPTEEQEIVDTRDRSVPITAAEEDKTHANSPAELPQRATIREDTSPALMPSSKSAPVFDFEDLRETPTITRMHSSKSGRVFEATDFSNDALFFKTPNANQHMGGSKSVIILDKDDLNGTNDTIKKN